VKYILLYNVVYSDYLSIQGMAVNYDIHFSINLKMIPGDSHQNAMLTLKYTIIKTQNNVKFHYISL
jgi:hypothetical protein